jgi:hypothetical protein
VFFVGESMFVFMAAPDLTNHNSTAFAEPDPPETLAFAITAQHDFVTVLQKSPLLAGGEFDRLSPALRQFEQAAEAVFGCAGYGAAGDEVA